MTSDARPPSDRPCLCGLTSGACPAHTYGGDVCACSTPGETHSPAIHARRPPSDAGTTGWWVRRRPVIVVDPAEARETIARVIADHYPTGYTCGETCDHNLNSPQGWAGHLATAVLAALAGQGQP